MVAFLDGITASELVVAELDELEELELLLELLEELIGGGRQGGTISVVTLLLAGSTSWSCGDAPVAEALEAPPGVIRIVLAGGGAIVALLELELELELELIGEPHGSIATVCVSVLLGITISLDPGGIALEPDCTTGASEHEVTAIVSGLCCCGMTTVRTPGLMRAAATGSWLELLLLLDPPPPLLPQPAIATTATTAPTDRVATMRLLFMFSSGVPVGWMALTTYASSRNGRVCGQLTGADARTPRRARTRTPQR
jgi:hypothetical protein